MISYVAAVFAGVAMLLELAGFSLLEETGFTLLEDGQEVPKWDFWQKK